MVNGSGGGTVASSSFDQGMLGDFTTTGDVEKGYVSKKFLKELFTVHGKQIVRVTTAGGTEISNTEIDVLLEPNTLPYVKIETDPSTGYITTTKISITSIEVGKSEANKGIGLWTSKFLSALGQNSGGGGGGGASALYQLIDVKPDNDQTPTAVYGQADGKVLKYSAADGKWLAGDVGNFLPLTGGIINNGDSNSLVISPSSIVFGYNGSAYGSISLVNGSDGLYLNLGSGAAVSGNLIATQSWVNNNGYATKTWVNNQGFLTSSDISDMATETWVNNQGFLTSSDISDMATKTWVNNHGFLTSVAFSDLTSHPSTLGGYGITDAAFGTAGSDYIPITLGGTTQNVLTAHQSLGGYATETWVNSNYLSLSFFRSLFKAYASDGITEIQPNGGTIGSIASIKAMFGFWTEQYLSALGNGSGGSGSSVALSDLVDVSILSPQTGQTIIYNSNSSKWENGTVGSVTAITAGTGLSGGTITGSGTIAINSTYQGYISHGETAYGWGNHANAGYLTSSSSIGFSQLPAMYIGNNAIHSSADATEVLQLGGLWLYDGTHLGGGVISFGDVNPTTQRARVYIEEDPDDELHYYAGEHTFDGDIIANDTVLIGGALLEWDSTNNALKIRGNLVVTGGITALG